MIPVLKDATVARVQRVLLLAVLVLAGCGAGNDPRGDGPTVVAALYPLAWVAQNVAGPELEVVDVTPPGAEPHDVEISPRDVETIRDAELVLFVGGGFQPAVEDALDGRDGPSLDLLREAGDPHVWLDPARMADFAEDVGQALGRRNAGRRLARRLRLLDAEYASGLARCERRTFVTSHAAFGRLASRYELTELSLGGSSPEAEPGPRTLERLVDDVRASGATTVFTEPLVSDRLARTIAREAGVGVGVLDPVEGLSEVRLAAGDDYLTVMRDNLRALREALGCR
jgi:zinc transport system substrate-binding protein